MSAVTIYTKSYCPYCHSAKDLLRQKGVQFQEIDVTTDRDGQAAMAQRAGRSTVPQVFIGDQHVGGCDDLYALERAGKLDTLLAA
ncbi:glutaredoxin 3 [Alsobacter metallidurans]|uniref:Glutaredoxin n=1 Tax=Alsobacter metallidurans TaxID=340221 RepID=A0A917MK10_9HYPH|nr:glutaredoxin 3 [Alsobacter metallidurans]GGH32683.1 glutaredoxin 3 [Alsobacter metallidurans]